MGNRDAEDTAADQLSAYEKAAADEDIDPRCIPIKLDGPVPENETIPYPDYPETDQETWRILFERQYELFPGRASRSYLAGHEKLGLSPDRIPSLRDLASRLTEISDWGLARIPGLLSEVDFFEFLARRRFPSTDYIRGREELDYTPAPDMFHDIFGHMPMITDPSVAAFYERFGHVAMKAVGPDRRRLERFYWFTVEFGLVYEEDGLRIYGSGILSSPKEVVNSLSNNVEVLPFDPAVMTETEYDVYVLQPKLFAVESFEQLERGFTDWVAENIPYAAE